MKKLKKNDEVIVLTGKDRGKRGKVVKVTSDDRIVVSGVNMIKKHVKPNPMNGTEGGIQEREASLHISNVAVFNAQTGKADRVGFKTLEDGSKVRVYKSNGEVIDS